MSRFILTTLIVLTLLATSITVIPTEQWNETTNFDKSEPVDSRFAGGTGTTANPYQIANITHLQWMGNTSNLGKNFTITKNIDASATKTWNSNQGFDPVGDSTTPFTGTLDGKGFLIENLTIDRSENQVGLFGVASQATIAGVHLHYCYITGDDEVGGLVGKAIKTQVSNCSVNATVKGDYTVGGMFGYNSGNVTHCSTRGKVEGLGQVGGLMAYNWGNITYSNSSCFTYGTGASQDGFGSLIGIHWDGTVINCNATGDAEGFTDTGALIGVLLKGTVQDCFSTGDVDTANQGGGIAGVLYSTGNAYIMNCTSYGHIYASTTAGGIVGHSADSPTGFYKIEKCRSYGDVESDGNVVGGIVGYLLDGSVNDSHSYGNQNALSTGNSYVGGITGLSEFSTISNCTSTGIIAIDNICAGGISGYSNQDSIMDCFSKKTISGAFSIGGLVGETWYTTIQRSTANCKVDGTQYIGGCVGYNEGMIDNCSSSGNVSGTDQVGGFAGWNAVEIIDSIAYGNVTGNTETGGFVGYNDGLLQRCTALADVDATGNFCGGLVGESIDEILSSCSFGNVEGVDYCGGIVGYTSNSVKDSYSVGNISGRDYCGGLAGRSFLSIKDSYAIGNVDGRDHCGGLVGYAQGPITDSWAKANVTAPTGSRVGGLIGESNIAVTNCWSNGSIIGDDLTGGLIGYSGALVQDCHADCFVSGNINTGGLVGKTQPGSKVSRCYSVGNVTATGGDTGGLVGEADGRIEHSWSYANVDAANNVGGIVGLSDDAIYNCSAYGEIIGVTAIGGLIGNVDGSVNIDLCRALGNVTGSGLYAGGFIGNINTGTINDCYAEGNVSTANIAGGFVGIMSGGSITQCYSLGNVTATADRGGFCGVHNTGTVTNCFWDNQTSGITFSDAGAGRYTSEMYKRSNFYSWDYAMRWWQDDGNDYPVFRWEEAPRTTIRTLSDLALMRYYRNEEYTLANNIDASNTQFWNDGDGWTPIGKDSERFYGDLEGNGYAILGLVIDRPTYDLQGLFGFTEGSKISNLTISGANIKGRDLLGAFSARSLNTVFVSCDCSCVVDGRNYVGGISGHFVGGSISDTYSVCVISGNMDVGGLVGHAQNTQISQCSSDLSFSDDLSVNGVGGLVGRMNGGAIDNSSSSISIIETGSSLYYAGGLVGGASTGTMIRHCYSVGAIVCDLYGSTTYVSRVGGLVGYNDGAIDRSYSEVSISASALSTLGMDGIAEFIGGLVGYNYHLVQDCYSTGYVVASSDFILQGVGGCIGYLYKGIIERSYSTGIVTTNPPPIINGVGGFIGIRSSSTVSDCFLDTTLSGTTILVGNGGSTGVSGKTYAEMNRRQTFLDAGWDLENVWVMIDNLTHPKLDGFYHNPIVDVSSQTSILEDEPFQGYFDVMISDHIAQNALTLVEYATDASWLTVDVQNNTFFGTPTNEDVGTYFLNITAWDRCDRNTSENITITVGNVNDPPVITTENVLYAYEDSEYSVGYTATDIDPTGDTLTWALHTKADWLSLNSNSGILNGTPENQDVGFYWVEITVRDGLGGHDMTNFTLEVINTNDPPTFSLEWERYIDEYEQFKVVVKPEDPDKDDVLTINFTSEVPCKFEGPQTIVTVGGVKQNFKLNISVTDKAGASTFKEIQVIVNNTNDPPVITTLPPVSTMEDALFSLDLTADDPDPSDTLTWNLSSPQDWLSISDSTLSGTPLNEHVGTHWVVIEATDEAGATDTLGFYLDVINVNDPPEWLEQVGNQTIYQGEELTVYASMRDVDPDDSLRIVYDGLKDGWKVSTVDEISSRPYIIAPITFIPPEDALGIFPITINYTDGEYEISQTFYLTIKERDTPPVDPPPIEDDDQDKDRDGIPDYWEDYWGFNKTNASDALEDPDNDLIVNLDEYKNRTNPWKSDLETPPADDDEPDDDITPDDDVTPDDDIEPDDDVVPDDDDDSSDAKSSSIVPWILVVIISILAIIFLIMFFMKKPKADDDIGSTEEEPEEDEDEEDVDISEEALEDDPEEEIDPDEELDEEDLEDDEDEDWPDDDEEIESDPEDDWPEDEVEQEPKKRPPPPEDD